MKKYFGFMFAFCVFGMAQSLLGQKGETFPMMLGKNLENKPVTISGKNTKFTVVGLVYNRDAEVELKKWLNPMYETFVKKSESGKNNFDMAEVYDVYFYFVPMISIFKKAVEDFKNGTDKEFWKYIVDSDTDIKMLKKKFNVTDDKEPYFYVLDKDGKIVEWVSGKYTAAKMSKIEDAAAAD